MANKPKILVIGQGFLGRVAKEHFGDRAILSSLNTTEPHLLAALIDSFDPDYVLNAAANTDTHGLERGENRVGAIAVNMFLALTLAQLCVERGKRVIQPSTGMMIDLGPDGWNKWNENDPPNCPESRLCYYTRQKLAMEHLLLRAGLVDPKAVIVARFHQPFAGLHHPKNLLSKMRTHTTFLDEQSSFTSYEDALTALDQLVQNPDACGLFHLTSPGTISHRQIAVKLKAAGLIDEGVPIEPMTRAELDALVKERGGAYQPRVLMESTRLRSHGIMMENVEFAVDQAIAKMANALQPA